MPTQRDGQVPGFLVTASFRVTSLLQFQFVWRLIPSTEHCFGPSDLQSVLRPPRVLLDPFEGVEPTRLQSQKDVEPAFERFFVGFPQKHQTVRLNGWTFRIPTTWPLFEPCKAYC